MRLADLADPLPEDLIAQEPAPERRTALFQRPRGEPSLVARASTRTVT